MPSVPLPLYVFLDKLWQYREDMVYLPLGNATPDFWAGHRSDAADEYGDTIEEVVIEVEQPYAGTVIMKLSQRRGELLGVHVNHDESQRLTFMVPSRGLLGYRSEFLTDSRGTGIMHTNFHSYQPYKGDITNGRNGALIALEAGVTTAYSLFNIQERGTLFVGAGEEAYAGQIIGEHARENDLVVNPCKKKQLNNMRSSGADEALILTPPRQMSLEQAIDFIQDDEQIELTPTSIRIRKTELAHNMRKKK